MAGDAAPRATKRARKATEAAAGAGGTADDAEDADADGGDVGTGGSTGVGATRGSGDSTSSTHHPATPAPKTPRKDLLAVVPSEDRYALSKFPPPLDSRGAVGKYVVAEAHAALQLGGMEHLAPILDELGLMDMHRLYSMHGRGLVSDDGPTRAACQLALLEAFRGTKAFTDLPTVHKPSQANLDSLSHWAGQFGPTSQSKRVAAAQSAAIHGIGTVAHPSGPQPDPPPAGGLSEEALTRLVTTVVEGVAAKAPRAPTAETAAKLPPTRAINDSCTNTVRAQLHGEMAPVAQVPIPSDVATAYEYLSSRRLPPLSALELPVGGRREKPTARTTKATRHKHPRAVGVGQEYMLLERYLYTVGWAASSPAGSDYQLASGDLDSNVYLQTDDPLVVYSQPARLAQRAFDAAAERAAEAASDAEEDHSAPTIEFPLIGLFSMVILFSASCRASGYAQNLNRAEASAHVDRVISELDDELYSNSATLTQAMRLVEKMRLAHQSSGAAAAAESSFDDTSGSDADTPKKRDRRERGGRLKDKKSKSSAIRKPRPKVGGSGSSRASPQGSRICPFFARGPGECRSGGVGAKCSHGHHRFEKGRAKSGRGD